MILIEFLEALCCLKIQNNLLKKVNPLYYKPNLQKQMEDKLTQYDRNLQFHHNKYMSVKKRERDDQSIKKRRQSRQSDESKSAQRDMQLVLTSIKMGQILNKIVVIIADYDETSHKQLKQLIEELCNIDIKKIELIQCLSCFLLAKTAFVEKALIGLSLNRESSIIKDIKNQLTAKIEHQMQSQKTIARYFQSNFSQNFKKNTKDNKKTVKSQTANILSKFKRIWIE